MNFRREMSVYISQFRVLGIWLPLPDMVPLGGLKKEQESFPQVLGGEKLYFIGSF